MAESTARTAVTVIGLALMAPVGFVYFATGLVAPMPDLVGAYALYAALLAAAVRLGRRRSWWVMIVPPVSVGLWFLMMWFGETVLGWSA